MSDEFKNADFLDDEEKMRDFTYLTYVLLMLS